MNETVSQWLSGPDFDRDPDDLSAEEVACLCGLLNRVQKACAERLKGLRNRALDVAKDCGKPSGTGATFADASGNKIKRVEYQLKKPDPEAVLDLLKAYGLEQGEAFDQVTTWELNPSKLDRLVNRGYLPEDKVEACRKRITKLVIEHAR